MTFECSMFEWLPKMQFLPVNFQKTDPPPPSRAPTFVCVLLHCGHCGILLLELLFSHALKNEVHAYFF